MSTSRGLDNAVPSLPAAGPDRSIPLVAPLGSYLFYRASISELLAIHDHPAAAQFCVFSGSQQVAGAGEGG